MKLESAMDKENVKALESQVLAQGEEVKRKAAAALAAKEAELAAEEKEAVAEFKIEQGVAKAEGLETDIKQQKSNIANLKAKAEAAMAAAEQKDAEDVAAGKEKANAIQKEALFLLARLKSQKEAAVAQDDVEDNTAEAKEKISQITSEVEGMKLESATAKESVKVLESKVLAQGEEVKRKAAAALAAKEAELAAVEEKEAEAETKIEQGVAKAEGLEADIEQQKADIEDLKAKAEAALAAAEQKDEEDVVAGKEKAKAILKEALFLLARLKSQKEVAVAQDASVLIETKSSAKSVIEQLTFDLKALEIKLAAETASKESLQGKLAAEIDVKKTVESVAEVALAQSEEERVHDATILAKNAGEAEELLAEKLAVAKVDNAELKNKVARMPTAG